MLRHAVAGGLLACGALAAHAGSLEETFANPPETARLQAWFHWNADCVTPEGLAADLKAMGALDVGTAHVFLPAMAHLPKTAVPLTPEWFKLWETALAEAKKNNIRLGFHNCPGWSSSGGPWIKPEDSMKMVVAGETDVEPGTARAKLPQPLTVRGFYRDIAALAFPVARPAKPVKVSGDFNGDFAAFLSGAAPLTLPLGKKNAACELVFEYGRPVTADKVTFSLDDSQLYAAGQIFSSADGQTWTPCKTFRYELFNAQKTPKILRLDRRVTGARFFKVKFAYIDFPPWIALRDKKLVSWTFTDLPLVEDIDAKNSAGTSFSYRAPRAGEENDAGIPRAAVADLTPGLAPDGTVDLAPLAGRPLAPGQVWRVLRVGYTSTGKNCAPATLPGLECDKLSKRGLDAHWPHMPARLLAAPGAKDVVDISIIDSYEVGGQNWTEDFPQEFRARRGYDLLPWLPAVAGYRIDTAGETAKFLFDYQRTVSDLFVENYYTYFAELCRKAGIRAAVEPYGGPFDSIRAGAASDVPTGEFWLGRDPYGSPRVAASIGHLHGRAQIAAEAFTTEAKEGRWQITPQELRRAGDRGWINGISQLVYHSYLHQPFGDVQPGISLGRHGTQLNRHTTWWPEGIHWSRYVRRGQALLQSGRPRADVLVFTGESTPNSFRFENEIVKAGGNFDFCDIASLGRLEARGGGVAVPDGLPYDVLYLGYDRYLSCATLRVIERLAAAGARVAGQRPRGTPTRADDPAEWNALVKKIWDTGTIKPAGTARAALQAFNLTPALQQAPGGGLRAARRVTDGRDVYFVLNTSDTPYTDWVTLAGVGAAELWNAVDGSRAPLSCGPAKEPSRVLLHRFELPAHGSCFVVFDPAREPKFINPKPDTAGAELDLSCGWTADNFRGKNAPTGTVTFAALASWSTSTDERLKYFAGRARYRKTFAWPSPAVAPARVELDLGDVRDVANVTLNGRFVACLWEAPYRADVTALLKSGENTLEIEVVNTWPNRLIGDDRARQNGAKEEMSKNGPWPQWVLDGKPDSGTGIYTWSNFRGWRADEELLPAGLLGPVRLRAYARTRPVVPAVVAAPDAEHAPGTRRHSGIPSLAVSRGGRLWATWYGGKTPHEDRNNYCVLSTSADGGATWKEVLTADPDGDGARRTFDPEVWIAPDGSLRWTWTDRDRDAGDDQLWMLTLDAEREPDAAVLPKPVHIGTGVMMCKPAVWSTGEWALPVARWWRENSSTLVVSEDGGRTFSLRGAANQPDAKERLFDEHQFIEKRNGDIWCLTRGAHGFWESVSKDRGVTWPPMKPARFKHTSSRIFVRRLKSGNLLLVKHGPVGRDVGRKQLTAFVSDDDGDTWQGGLMLDERAGVSYPDGQETDDGRIFLAYDFDRTGTRAIHFCTFTEADARAGKDVSGKVALRRLVSRAP